jgi:cysteine sulfinate desulfinase/cysteine desulfurase-like protein
VLVAMQALTHGHLRISFGPELELPTADAFLGDLREVITELRTQSGRRQQ